MERKLKKLTLITEEWFRAGEYRYGPDKSSWRFKCPKCGHIVTFNDWEPRSDKSFIVDCYKCNWKGKGVNNPIFIINDNIIPQNVFDFADDPLTE